LCRKKEQDYNQNLIETFKYDSKILWKNLKQITKNKEKPLIFITFDGIMENDHNRVANKLNEYFINSILDINNSIPVNNVNVAYSYLNNYQPKEQFKFSKLNVQDLIIIMKNINNKTSGLNNLNVNVLLDSMDVAGSSFLQVINTSLELGEFPDKWKKSTVIPIPKIAGTKCHDQLRPINILPAYEKVLETIVKNQLLKFLERNNILVSEQSGFRPQHSCETSLNLTVSSWKQMIEEGKVIVAVFLDFKRAFETIDRDWLLWKLE
jgi:Reverse transcriptase (RNA-dependent DNA polymerase)